MATKQAEEEIEEIVERETRAWDAQDIDLLRLPLAFLIEPFY